VSGSPASRINSTMRTACSIVESLAMLNAPPRNKPA
jgi:hypothetical protein